MKAIIKKRTTQFQDMFSRLYPVKGHENDPDHTHIPVKDVTFVVTQDCNLRCSYCYEHHKNSCNKMSKETAVKTIDKLFEESEKTDGYMSPEKSQAIILEFIGGEPLLEIELIDFAVDYFKYKAITLNHRWAKNYIISISTNGILYESDAVQRFLDKNEFKVSVSITIDGNKELHDSCRKFPDGTGSYDVVEKSFRAYLGKSNFKTTKLTLSPDNVRHLSEAVKHLYSIGLEDVFANCVFEKGWTTEHAKVLYDEMKKLADHIIGDNNYERYACTLFDQTIGKSLDAATDNRNWCGGTGNMLAIDANGNMYPCLRYLPFSLREGRSPIVIGDIHNGIEATPEQRKIVAELNSITRRSQSTDECFNCPIASGCAWCSAYNYEETGTPNKRVTYICVMHKARVLANAYFWNKIFDIIGKSERFPLNVPDEWALEIIDRNELEMLKRLSNQQINNNRKYE